MSNPSLPHTWPRLFVDAPLSAKATVPLSPEQTHYLVHVMRAQVGEPLRVFNGRDGEWLARLPALPQRKKDLAVVSLESQRRPQSPEPDVWMCCAPLRRQHFDALVMKATELGAAVIQPILTERTQVRDCGAAHLRAIAMEAAEQSERLTMPEVREPMPLPKLLATWPQGRLALICAEFGEALPLREALTKPLAQSRPQAAILTGPEGGWTEGEMRQMKELPETLSLRLGPRILRADTAALAALSCWQALCGDWQA